jgi:thioredoxin reductase (NADPH)
MENEHDQQEVLNSTESIASEMPAWLPIEFREELAFPTLTVEMVDRLKAYGTEESIPAGVTLYSSGDRQIDMFVILDGGVDITLPRSNDKKHTFARHRKLNFTGEFNLLSAQRAIVEARTITNSTVLRISRTELPKLMRSEGDIANLIVQAFTWRRIGIAKSGSSGVVVTGKIGDPQLALLQRFFVRNIYPHQIVELSPSEASKSDDGTNKYPAVVLSDGRTLHNPPIPDLADELGISRLPDSTVTCDVAVVGAGPAGLAAAVYAASEGLCTVVIEGLAPGGQAGTSSKIENYLGFPTGVGGQQLAIRAQMQALKFGVHFAISREVVSVEQQGAIHRLILSGGIPVCARSVVVATGAQYRKLNLGNDATYENRGLYYAATAMESPICRGQEVIVVGGGNSAGQAALFLSGIATHVHHIVRQPSFASSMSQYLISRIENSSHITLYTDSEIVAVDGVRSLESATWANRLTGVQTQKPIGAVFVMIGAEPNTGWLYGTVKLNDKGFILTGNEYGFEKSPYATSMPGIFAVGDVRAGSVKRVASAVGEGSVVISDIHRYIVDHRNEVSRLVNSVSSEIRTPN